MFCTKCGKENEATATHCVECGEALIPVQPQAAAASAQPQAVPIAPVAPMSTGAIWSFILSLLAILCFGPLTGIPAIIVGHIAYSNIKKSQGAFRGNGLAIAGLIIGYASILIFILLLALGVLGALIESQM